MRSFNSIEAAKFFGVNVSSIKRWTDEGKLKCIQTPGGHRKFLITDFIRFIEENQDKVKKVNLFPIEDNEDIQLTSDILKGDFLSLTRYLETAAFTSDRKKAQKILNGLYLMGYPLYQIFDDLVSPVLYRIGERWAREEITILEEHLASDTIRESLCRFQGIVKLPDAHLGKALCLTLSGELHDIPLKMADYILEEQGFAVFNSGRLPETFFRIKDLFRKIKPDRLYLSSTVVTEPEKMQREADHLFTLCEKYHTAAYLGGKGFDVLNLDHPIFIQRLYKFKEIVAESESAASV